MKKLINFYTSTPSYFKCGNEAVSKRSGVAISTIKKFKKSPSYATLKSDYLNKTV